MGGRTLNPGLAGSLDVVIGASDDVSPAPWRAEPDAICDAVGDTVCRDILARDAAAVVALRNAWPGLQVRLARLEALRAAILEMGFSPDPESGPDSLVSIHSGLVGNSRVNCPPVRVAKIIAALRACETDE